MSKSKHTPGPWYGKPTSAGQGLIIDEKSGAAIAVSYDAEQSSLIAAAPDLLNALEMAEGVVAHYVDMHLTGSLSGRAAVKAILLEIRRAITAAKGGE